MVQHVPDSFPAACRKVFIQHLLIFGNYITSYSFLYDESLIVRRSHISYLQNVPNSMSQRLGIKMIAWPKYISVLFEGLIQGTSHIILDKNSVSLTTSVRRSAPLYLFTEFRQKRRYFVLQTGRNINFINAQNCMKVHYVKFGSVRKCNSN